MDNPEDQTQASPVSPAAEAPAIAVKVGRRRLLRGGLAAAPALLALKSTPVLACNCKNPSGFTMSGNLSRKLVDRNCADPARKPSGWRTNCTGTRYNISSVSIYKSAKFKDYFSTNGTYVDKTFDAALNGLDTDPQALIVAVYLEAAANGNGTTFPNTTMVKNMWNLGVIGGNYKPTTSSADTWNAAEVIYYLKYLTNQL